MDTAALRARVLAVNLDVFGVPMTVTRPAPDNDPIATRGIWITPDTEGMPVGADYRRTEQRNVLALSRLDVPEIPTGTRAVGAGPAGGADRTWQVDGFAGLERDHIRVIVVDVTED